jgi:hypothetical protein
MKIELLGADEFSKALKKLGSDLPATLATGLNRTMRAIEQAELNAMESSLDRPSPFTMNALGVQLANSRHLDASIFLRPLQADYLKSTIEGGVVERTIVPFRIKRDKHGNIPGKKRGWAGMARGKSVFVSKIEKGRAKGKTGLWRKQGQSAFLLALADKNARREKRWPYFETAERVAAKRLQSDVLGAIDDAMRKL